MHQEVGQEGLRLEARAEKAEGVRGGLRKAGKQVEPGSRLIQRVRQRGDGREDGVCGEGRRQTHQR